VAELVLAPACALPALLKPARLGRPDGEAGVKVRGNPDAGLVLVLPFRGKRREAAARLAAAIGVAPPEGSSITRGSSGTVVAWAGPEGWLVATPWAPDLELRLAGALGESAAVIDQSDGRVMLSLTGPALRAVLAKGIELDLHEAAFPVGRTAITKLSHLTVQLWLFDATPRVDLIIPRAAADDIWHWLTESALEYGLEVVPPS
jgi:methylglutamate dehydrogenase subunit D